MLWNSCAGSGNETDPRETQSGGSHAKSHYMQQERGSTHHSTRKVALCVGGTQVDDESVRESKRCAGKSGSGPDMVQDGL